MKRLFFLLLFISQLTYAQVEKDSLLQKADSLKAKFEKPIQSLDSAAAATKQKVDSLKNELNEKVDSLQASYHRAKGKVVAAQTKIQQKIDSLRILKLPTEKLQAKADSLQQDLFNIQKKVASDIDSLKLKVAGKFNSLKISPEAKAQVAKYSSILLGKVDLPFIDKGLFNKTEINEVSLQLPGVDQPNLTENLPGMENGEIPGVDGLAVKEKLGPVSEIKQEAKEIKEKIEDGQAMVVVEEKAEQLEEVGVLKKVLPSESSVPIPDGTQTQQEMVGQVKKAAINHFAGKAEVVQSAMTEISKYKKKYSSIQSLKDLKNMKPVNPMKGKLFIERVVPGLLLYIHRRNDWRVDFNPYVGYRLNEKLIIGAGWNHRLTYNYKHNNLYGAKVYGPRLYGEYELFKGFHPRVELELMRTYVSPFSLNGEKGSQQWVRTMLIGLNKKYKISQHIQGTSSVMFNLFDIHNKSPYGDKVVVRIGFEVWMKKKKQPN